LNLFPLFYFFVFSSDLVLKHNYDLSSVQPLSDGAADINADAAANEYIDVGTIAVATGDISLSAWVYVTDWVNFAGIITNRHASDPYPGVQLRCSNGAQSFDIIIDDGASDNVVTSSVKNSNQWYHLCAVMDRSGSQYLYVDGILEGSSDITDEALTLNHATSTFIGKNYGNTEFRGYICNVGYWNRVLTQAEIKSIMNKNYAGLTSSEKTDLVSWWNLDSVIPDTTTLVYDNHHGGGEILSSELLTDGGFASGNITGAGAPFTHDNSSGNAEIVNQQLVWTSAASGNNVQHNSVQVAGNTYKVTFDIVSISEGGFKMNHDSSGGKATTGQYSFTYTAPDTSFYIRAVGTTSGIIDNISLKKINGNTGTLS